MTKRLKIMEALQDGQWRTAAFIAAVSGLHSKVARPEISQMVDDGFLERRAADRTNGWEFRIPTTRAQQGHLYEHQGRRVLALESGERVKVAEIVDDEHWPVRSHYECHANALRPLPMRYFHGATPR